MIRLTRKFEKRWPCASSGWAWQADWHTTSVWRRTRPQAVVAVIFYHLVIFGVARERLGTNYVLPWWVEKIVG